MKIKTMVQTPFMDLSSLKRQNLALYKIHESRNQKEVNLMNRKKRSMPVIKSSLYIWKGSFEEKRLNVSFQNVGEAIKTE